MTDMGINKPIRMHKKPAPSNEHQEDTSPLLTFTFSVEVSEKAARHSDLKPWLAHEVRQQYADWLKTLP